MDMTNDEFLREYLTPPFPRRRGCALLGKTNFFKLEAVKTFLKKQGFAESGGSKEAAECFIIHDCQDKAQRPETITKIVSKYRNTPYVIFNNCGRILKNNDVLRVFAHIIDKDEYMPPFETSSFYIFLANENLLPKANDCPAGSAFLDHIQSFCSFVGVYDFDAQRQFI
jgi:hypothetical protein